VIENVSSLQPPCVGAAVGEAVGAAEGSAAASAVCRLRESRSCSVILLLTAVAQHANASKAKRKQTIAAEDMMMSTRAAAAVKITRAQRLQTPGVTLTWFCSHERV
jgi:hypothetical protein